MREFLTFIENDVEPSANGIAIFACFGADEFFETAQIIPSFPNNRVFDFERPHLFPLIRTMEQNPPFMVLWSDTNKAEIYVFGGEDSMDAETESDKQVEEIENVVTRRSKAGGWSQARFQRRIENFHLQHAKETVETVEKLMRETRIDKLILSGDEAVIMPHLLPQLSKEVEEKVIGHLNLSQYSTEDEIYQAAIELFRTNDAKDDEEAVERAIGASKAAAGMGVTGIENTLTALLNGQVEEMVISASFDVINYSAKKVKKVLKAYAPGDDSLSIDDLPDAREPRQIADELLVQALNTSAKVRFIEESDLLKQIGGVAAVLRYSMNSAQ
ncbi:MAG: hypothetical protein HC846_08660 [Blastocatellia bacterium]|nr:hypothetical protein [Blastocatellia bacterium]